MKENTVGKSKSTWLLALLIAGKTISAALALLVLYYFVDSALYK